MGGVRKGPLTRRRAAEDSLRKLENKRRRKVPQPHKCVGPNDIVVDLRKSGIVKVKVEEDHNVDMNHIEVIMVKEEDTREIRVVTEEIDFTNDDSDGVVEIIPSIVGTSPEFNACSDGKVETGLNGGTSGRESNEEASVLGHGDRPEKVIDLFSEVIKVYWDKFAQNQKNSKELLNLNCRLACKAWKNGMDDLLTSTNSPVDLNTKLNVSNGSPSEIEKKFQNVSHRYKKINWYPFPPQELTIFDVDKYPTIEEVARCRTAILKFLTRFGQHITTFRHKGNAKHKYRYTSYQDWYLTFRTWIGLMPNLKELYMETELNCGESWEAGLFSDLEELVNSHPLPKLPQLQVVSIHGPIPLTPVLNSLLTVNGHIQRLDTNWPLGKKKLTFPNLVYLGSVINNESIEIGSLLESSLSLEEVEFLFAGNKDNCTQVWNKIVTLDRLKSLIVHFSTPWSCPRGQLQQMSHLKELVLDNYFDPEQRASSWTGEFILQMVCRLKSLEKISINKFDPKTLKKPGQASSEKVETCLRNRFMCKLQRRAVKNIHTQDQQTTREK